MIYELRTYRILPGKMAEFLEAFGRIPAPLFEKHGARLIGVWETEIGRSNEVTYILAFDDLGHRDRVWQAYRADPDRARYMAEGVRVDHLVSKILRPVSYSPLQ